MRLLRQVDLAAVARPVIDNTGRVAIRIGGFRFIAERDEAIALATQIADAVTQPDHSSSNDSVEEQETQP